MSNFRYSQSSFQPCLSTLKILTQMSIAHWFTVLGARMSDFKHHLLSLNPPSGSQAVSPSERAVLRGRCMQIRALKVFPIEVIVRGYITGSAWDESVSPCLLRKSLSAASTILTFLCVGTKSTRQFTAFHSPQDCSAARRFRRGQYTP